MLLLNEPGKPPIQLRHRHVAMRNVANPATCPALEARKAALEADLRARFADKSRDDIKALPEMQAYAAYYKRFKKTYHVQLQLESVALKDKPIPSVAALVETMFMGELKNFLLTAVHDLDVVQPPVSINVADGSERYVMMNNEEQPLKPAICSLPTPKAFYPASSMAQTRAHRSRRRHAMYCSLFTRRRALRQGQCNITWKICGILSG
jgi:hypothetical protein